MTGNCESFFELVDTWNISWACPADAVIVIA